MTNGFRGLPIPLPSVRPSVRPSNECALAAPKMLPHLARARGQPLPQSDPEQSRPSFVRITKVSDADRKAVWGRGFRNKCRGSYLLLRRTASMLWPKIKGQTAEKVLPRSFCAHRLPSGGAARHLSQGSFHGQLSHLTVRWTLGMKSEPPFTTARGQWVALAHDADVNATHF